MGPMSALMFSLERTELLRSIRCAAEGLLREAEEVRDAAAEVAPELRKLIVEWDDCPKTVSGRAA